MKIFASGDWHGDWVTGGMSRHDDVCDRATEVVNAAIAANADLFVFLGDLTDPDTTGAHASVRLACSLASRLVANRIPSCWLAGNHDVAEDGRGTTMLGAIAGFEAGRGLPLVRVFESPSATILELRSGPLAFVALPYPSRANHYDPAEWVSQLEPLPPGIPCLVAGHLWIDGAPTDGSESTDLQRGRGVFWPIDALKEKLPTAQLVGGHYHKAGIMRGVSIAGSLERLTFGEELHMPGFLVLEWQR